MNPSVSLGRIAGVRIGINWSWLVVFALIGWSLESSVFPDQNPHLSKAAYVGMALVAAVLFFASLVLHELGHALQARRDGMEIDGITLWLFGGVARFRGIFPSAGAELRIAIAGPLVSLVLGGLFIGVAQTIRSPVEVKGVAAWLGYINLILLAFNMLPALPLDGGRVFRAILWRTKGDFAWSTRIAARAGRGFGYLLIAVGLTLLVLTGSWGGIWFAFIGWFLVQAATAEARHASLREAFGDLHVSDVMTRHPEVVRANASLTQFMDQVAHTHRYTTYPVVDDGHVLGLLPFNQVAAVPRREWGTSTVYGSMLTLDQAPIVREDEELMDALDQLTESRLDRALVLDGDRLVGLLSISDISRLLAAPTANPGAR